MAINITPLSSNNIPALGFSVQWDEGQFVMLITDKGLISCGIVDMKIIEKFNFAATVTHGTPEAPLVTVDDLLKAKIHYISTKAAEYGVKPGMTGAEALDKLSQ